MRAGIGGGVAMPVSRAVTVPPPETLTVAAAFPGAMGRNSTDTLQVAPGASAIFSQLFPATTKAGPVSVTASGAVAWDVPLVTVSVWGALRIPTTPVKTSAAGAMVMARPEPVSALDGIPPGAPMACSTALRMPAAVGPKRTTTGQLAAGATGVALHPSLTMTKSRGWVPAMRTETGPLGASPL